MTTLYRSLPMLWFAWATTVTAEELPKLAKPGTYRLTTVSGGFERTAHIHIPKSYDSKTPLPLVLGLHGGGGSGERFLIDNGWADLAEAKGAIIASPDGLPANPKQKPNFKTNPPFWNCGQLPAISPRSKIDDVAYFVAMLDELAERVKFDPKRVFVAGHSMGGGMAFRFAELKSERVAAIATVAGVVSSSEPKPKKPVPTLYIHGSKDPILPPDGGEVKLPWGKRTSKPVSDNLAIWTKAIEAEATATDVSNQKDLKIVEYKPKKSGAKLMVITIEGHGHAWPGGKSHGLPESILGPITEKLDATKRIWEFFEDVSAKR